MGRLQAVALAGVLLAGMSGVLLQPLPLPVPGLEFARTNGASGELVQPGSQGSSTAHVIPAPVNIASAAVPASAVTAVTGEPLLTTKDGGDGVKIVDGSGTEVVFHGIGWYGFNIGLTVTGNLTAGKTAVGRDWKQIVYRMKMLGFNAIRLPFSFDDVNGLGQPPINYEGVCVVPTTVATQRTLIPPAFPQSAGPLSGNALPPASPPTIDANMCNSALPSDSTYKRFVWMIKYLAQQGFYINVDFHSNKWGGIGDQSVFNKAQWIANWAALLRNILTQAPEAKGRLLIDLMNEPDGYDMTWEGNLSQASLTSYYVDAIDALYPICPGCLFLVEGTGQSKWRVNWGNGFVTDQQIVKSANISDASSFFQAIQAKPWLAQVVLAPHIYCPQVSGANEWYAGKDLWNYLSKSFGYLTTTGYCDPTSKTCTKFAVIVDEFGSTFQDNVEKQCFNSIVQYMNNVGEANDKQHTTINSWFYWAWQPESFGTGGIVADDQETIMWNKVNALTGGTAESPSGLGLSPWYLAAFNNVQGTVRGAPPPAATTTVGDVYPAVSATPTKPVQLPTGAVTWLPPPLPQTVLDPTTPSGKATMVFDRAQKQQVVGDTGGGDDGPPVYLPTVPKAQQIIGGGSSADDIQQAKKAAATSPGPAYFPGSQAVETFAQKKYNGTDSSPVIIPRSDIGTTRLAEYIVLGIIGGAVVIGAAITGGVMLRKRASRR